MSDHLTKEHRHKNMATITEAEQPKTSSLTERQHSIIPVASSQPP